MSQLKQLLEKATQKNEMKWRVYAYDPAKDNKLVHTSELFDDINGAGIEKAEWLKKHPEHTIEIIAESAQKNEDRLADLGYKVGDTFIIKDLPSYLKGKTAKILSSPYHNAPIAGEYVVDCIELTTGKKFRMPLDRLPKHTNESADIDVKNPGVLEVPDGKKVDELPQSHFEKLIDKKGYAEVIRALTNLEVWNKDKNKSLSSWASNMADKLKKKFRPESVQKNEDIDRNTLATIAKEVKSTFNNLASVKSGVAVDYSARLEELTFRIAIEVPTEKLHNKLEDERMKLQKNLRLKYKDFFEKNNLKPWGFGILIEENPRYWYNMKSNADYYFESAQKNEADPNAEKTLITKKQTIQRLAAKLTNDNLLPQLKQFKDYVDDVYNFALKNFDESAQMNETRSYTVTVKLEVPDKMNNRDIEDYIENRVDNSNFGVYVLDVTAERK